MPLNENNYAEFQRTSISQLKDIEKEITLSEDGEVLTIPHNEAILYLTYFYMPNTPWITPKSFQKANEILKRISTNKVDKMEILNLIKLKFNDLSSMKKSNSNRKSKELGNGRYLFSNISKLGLMPHLGYSAYADSRNQWKDESIYIISSLYWYLEVFARDEKSLRVNWTFFTSSILKIMDFSESNIKILSCTVLSVLLDSVQNKNNYLVKSGLHLEFMDTISIGFSYLPPTLNSIESCIPLLDSCFDTYLKLIDKCFRNDETKIDSLIELMNNEIFDKCAMAVFNLDQSDKISILNVYLKFVSIVINEKFDYNIEAVYLVLRDLLRKFLLKILIDGFLFFRSTEIILCEKMNVHGDYDFIIKVLKLLVNIIELTPERIQKYKFDILTAVILFTERLEMELLNEDMVFPKTESSAKIVEIDIDSDTDICSKRTNLQQKDHTIEDVALIKISNEIKIVLKLVLEVGENKNLRHEILTKKSFMKKYLP